MQLSNTKSSQNYFRVVAFYFAIAKFLYRIRLLLAVSAVVFGVGCETNTISSDINKTKKPNSTKHNLYTMIQQPYKIEFWSDGKQFKPGRPIDCFLLIQSDHDIPIPTIKLVFSCPTVFGKDWSRSFDFSHFPVTRSHDSSGKYSWLFHVTDILESSIKGQHSNSILAGHHQISVEIHIAGSEHRHSLDIVSAITED